MGFLGLFLVTSFSHLLLFYSINYYFFSPDDEKRNEIFNEMIDKLINSLPQIYEGLDPFPVDSKIKSILIDSNNLHLNVVTNNPNYSSGHLRYTIPFDEKSKQDEFNFLKTFKWLFKSHPLWDLAQQKHTTFEVEMLEKNYKFYYIMSDLSLSQLENFSNDFSEDLYPIHNPDYDPETNPNVPQIITEKGQERVFLMLEHHVDKKKLEIKLIDKSDGISEFEKELTKKEKAENELAKFLYYLSNSGIVKNLENKKRLDPSFGYNLDYGINKDDEFYYTLETFKIKIDGSKQEGSEKNEEVYNPNVSDILEKAGATVVKIDPESRKLYIQNPELKMENNASVNLAVTEGSKVGLDTGGQSVKLDGNGQSVALNTANKSVELNVSNKKVALDVTGKEVNLNVPKDSQIGLKTTDDTGKLKQVELKVTDENGETKTIAIDGIGTEEWNTLIGALSVRQEKLKIIDQNNIDKYKFNYDGDDSLKIIEKSNAKYLERRNKTTIDEPNGELDLIGRELQAWKQKHSLKKKGEFNDSYGDTVEIKQGYYANQDPLVKAYTELNNEKYDTTQARIYYAQNGDLKLKHDDVSKEVENLDIIKPKLPIELTDYEIVAKVGEKFFDSSKVEDVQNDLDLQK
ncbi:hypothetical protein [Psychrilyobacter atlanticus]|uniref:hypothetical protein n=1 Tax=Psychrilyobacter atlanticus TaxID=271091 RepID=UPI00041B9CBC|nr:hypothetical protein [Psychrilyobacter atlanticus]